MAPRITEEDTDYQIKLTRGITDGYEKLIDGLKKLASQLRQLGHK